MVGAKSDVIAARRQPDGWTCCGPRSTGGDVRRRSAAVRKCQARDAIGGHALPTFAKNLKQSTFCSSMHAQLGHDRRQQRHRLHRAMGGDLPC